MSLDRLEQLSLVLLLEACLGYPEALHRRIRHPVVWIGSLIVACERRCNMRTTGRDHVAGALLVLMLILIAGGAASFVQQLAQVTSVVVALLVATTGLAQRSLYTHVADVLEPLAAGDLERARRCVARIVGRDTAALDESGVATAAIESLAESFCDGVIAPAFWYAVAGLPGMLAYKAVNTADSLIGHRDARHRAFGWAAARSDDLMNLIPARIAGVLLCMAGLRGFPVMWRDARKHASPNAGWSEAAMAGALGVQLGGPVSYEGVPAWRQTFGDGLRPAAGDLRRALRVYVSACLVLWLVVGVAAWLH